MCYPVPVRPVFGLFMRFFVSQGSGFVQYMLVRISPVAVRLRQGARSNESLPTQYRLHKRYVVTPLRNESRIRALQDNDGCYRRLL